MALPLSPPLLSAGRIDLDVFLKQFETFNLTDTAFATVSIDIPTEPIIVFPPFPVTDDPALPESPEIEPGDFVPQQLLSLEADVGGHERVDIAIPLPTVVEEWTDLVPVFETTVPDGQVPWEYEEFSYALSQVLTDRYDLLFIPVEYLSRLQQRNHEIWSEDQDWVTQRGQENTYLKRKNKEDKKNASAINTWTIIENYKSEIDLKKMFVSGRQAHEEMLRGHHDVRQKLNFSFVQSVMTNGVKHFNACVQKFNAQIETYRELSSVYIGTILRQGVIIQDLVARFKLSTELANFNTSLLQRIRTEVALQKQIIRFFQSQMELAKAELRVELLQAQLDRLEIQTFAELNKAIIDEIRQDIVAQEAEIAKLKIVKLDAIKAKLEVDLEIATVNRNAALDKFSGDRKAFNTIQNVRAEQHNNFDQEVNSREDLLNAQLLFDQSRGIFSRESAETEVLDVQLRQARLIEKFEADLIEVTAIAKTDKTIAENDSTLAKARVDAREDVKASELDAQRTLAVADIVQSLIHELSAG